MLSGKTKMDMIGVIILKVLLNFFSVAKVLNEFVWFYGVSTVVDHSMANPFYTYVKLLISKHILKITFLNKPELFFFFCKY